MWFITMVKIGQNPIYSIYYQFQAATFVHLRAHFVSFRNRKQYAMIQRERECEENMNQKKTLNQQKRQTDSDRKHMAQ